MPLPPAPSRRAALLAPEAYDMPARDGKAAAATGTADAAAAPAPARKPATDRAAAQLLASVPAAEPGSAASETPAVRSPGRRSPARADTMAAPARPGGKRRAGGPAAEPGGAASETPAVRSPGRRSPARADTMAAPASPVAAAPGRGRPQRRRPQGPATQVVLDTNVLLHDPACLFRFEEHDIFLPMIVLEELDSHKNGMTEVARNGRQASRTLDALAAAAQGADMAHGVGLDSTGQRAAGGHLFFQTAPLDYSLPTSLPPGKADNQILGVVQALRKLHAPRQVVLVSKDINMRVKARALGLNAEDYQNDKTLEDGDLLYAGVLALPPDFWAKSGKNVQSWQSGAHMYYRIGGPIVPQLMINQFVCFEAPGEPSLFARVSEILEKN